MAIFAQLSLRVPEDVHLLQLVYEFALQKSAADASSWLYREISEPGSRSCYWFNSSSQETRRTYPYLEELQSCMDAYRRLILRESAVVTLKQDLAERWVGGLDEDQLARSYARLKAEVCSFIFEYLTAYAKSPSARYDLRHIERSLLARLPELGD